MLWVQVLLQRVSSVEWRCLWHGSCAAVLPVVKPGSAVEQSCSEGPHAVPVLCSAAAAARCMHCMQHAQGKSQGPQQLRLLWALYTAA